MYVLPVASCSLCLTRVCGCVADGFGLFTAHNTSHASWQWVQTLKPTGDRLPSGELDYVQVRNVQDTLTIVQTSHGPRT